MKMSILEPGGPKARARLACLLGAVLASTPAALSAEGLAISHPGVACVAAGKFPRLEATLAPPDQVRRAQVHFRSVGGAHWYQVTMRGDGGLFRGILPKPKKSLKQLEYYIEATGVDLATARTVEFRPVVVSGPGACREKVIAGTVPSASVVVEGSSSAPPIPAGFESQGVVASASATAATAVAGGAVAAGAGAAAASSLAANLLALGVAGAVAGGLAALDPTVERSSAGSGGGASVDCDNLPPGMTTLSILVTAGPVFNWTPPCAVADILVEEAPNGSDVGGAQGTPPYRPPVGYSGAPLQARAYNVVLFDARGQLVGAQTFIP